MSDPTRREAILAAAKLGLVTMLTPAWLMAQGAAEQTAGRITLVLVNDLDRMGDKTGRGGHAKLAAVAKAERQRPNTLLIHAGDAYSPSILSGFDKGAHIVDILNLIAPDVFVPGNHEFDFGANNFRSRVKQSTFDVVGANILEQDGSLVAGLKPTKTVDVAEFRIGFVGVCTEDTQFLSNPEAISFRPAVEVAKKLAGELREAGADIVVAVTHIKFAEDLELLRSQAADVILSGHDHNLITFWDGQVVLVESASQADFVTPVDLLIERTEREGQKRVAFVPHVRPIDTLSVAPDPEIMTIIEAYEADLDKDLNVAIGTTETVLDTRRGPLRSQENAFGNLVCDAMRAAVGADICITNSGGIRADREYPAGFTLTRRHVLEELPFGNKTVMLEVSGAVVRSALENGLRGGGRFPQVSGMVVKADTTRPAGSRVVSVMVAGKPLDEGATYKLAANDFMTRGGDDYSMLSSAKTLIDPLAGQYMAGQVIGYISRLGTVAPKVEGRMILIR
jgi:5'-nucleotidase/UDP-sugar diphosphatase